MVGGEGEEPFTPLHVVITLCIKTCKGGWSGGWSSTFPAFPLQRWLEWHIA